jgi:hypothetical protein
MDPMARRNPDVSDDVMIAVDPHKASNTAAVLDPVSKTLIGSAVRRGSAVYRYVSVTTWSAFRHADDRPPGAPGRFGHVHGMSACT